LLPPDLPAGQPIDAAGLSDCVIEIDNKSLTHRPDLWGHYGIAREVAAIYRLPLADYPAEQPEALNDPGLPDVPIVIDDPDRCPRYTGLIIGGLRSRPAPLWMQARLSHVGLRPIDLLVDLTNYVLADLGQPMHAFDARRVDRIEVAVAPAGETFTTLDGVQRTLPAGALMIQSGRRSVALAGIMGGADTEVTEATTSILLESANFEPAGIRRTATAMGHRTEASARFEKSLDPHYTVQGIGRFVRLLRAELPDVRLLSRLSDAWPKPPQPLSVSLDREFVGRFVGQEVSAEQISGILTAIGFECRWDAPGRHAIVGVPSFRATRDIQMEADVIEEIARFVGFGTIEPALPRVTIRDLPHYPPSRLAKRCLQLMCGGMGFVEVHNYVWYAPAFLRRLGFDPGECVELRNPAAAGGEPAPWLRQTLLPGLLEMVDRNRHHFEAFDLVEIGGAFLPAQPQARQEDRLAAAIAARGKDDATWERLRQVAESLAVQVCDRPCRFAPLTSDPLPWEDPHKRAAVHFGQAEVGTIALVPADCKRRIDAHLPAWSVGLMELDLTAILHLPDVVRPAPRPEAFPQVDLDFSIVAAQTRSWQELRGVLASFTHPHLVRMTFRASYEGKSLGAGLRSITVRLRAGSDQRTLRDDDLQAFREAFVNYLGQNDLVLRA